VTARVRTCAGLVLVVVACLLGALVAGCGRETPTVSDGAALRVTHPDIGFRSRSRLDEHFRKHGEEFGRIDRGRYLALAQALRDGPLSDDVLELRRDDGVITRFDRTTGAFIAFNRDRTIRTFFRPNDGIAYFRRQADR